MIVVAANYQTSVKSFEARCRICDSTYVIGFSVATICDDDCHSVKPLGSLRTRYRDLVTFLISINYFEALHTDLGYIIVDIIVAV